MLKIRLQKIGKRNAPSYRVVLTEHTSPPQGKFIEILGFYNPRLKKKKLKEERIKHWLSKGVQVSPTIHNLLVDENIIKKKKIKAWKAKKKEEKEESSQKLEKPIEKSEEVLKPSEDKEKAEEKTEDKKSSTARSQNDEKTANGKTKEDIEGEKREAEKIKSKESAEGGKGEEEKPVINQPTINKQAVTPNPENAGGKEKSSKELEKPIEREPEEKKKSEDH